MQVDTVLRIKPMNETPQHFRHRSVSHLFLLRAPLLYTCVNILAAWLAWQIVRAGQPVHTMYGFRCPIVTQRLTRKKWQG